MKILSLFVLILLVGCSSMPWGEGFDPVTDQKVWVPGRDFPIVAGDIEEQEKRGAKANAKVSNWSQSAYISRPLPMKQLSPVDVQEPENNQKQYHKESVLSIKRIPATIIDRGMSKGDVEALWGRPLRIDYAGNPVYQNERWVFNDRQGEREVYFENGLVDGWEIK